MVAATRSGAYAGGIARSWRPAWLAARRKNGVSTGPGNTRHTRCAALAAVPADRLAEALITRYPPAAGIGWHRDAPAFGPTVVGVSLLSACTMRFQRRVRGERRVFELELEPRSVYVLGGSVRAVWQHSIPAVERLRYSVTFRSVRSGVV
jgi:alkylated DNA repair dioxygenase AlkB